MVFAELWAQEVSAKLKMKLCASAGNRTSDPLFSSVTLYGAGWYEYMSALILHSNELTTGPYLLTPLQNVIHANMSSDWPLYTGAVDAAFDISTHEWSIVR